MLRIDKDMERLMMEKKKEVLFDLEKAKKRILEELYCLRRSVHTDVCGLLADYNRIQLELRELTEELKKEIEETTDSFSKIFADTYNSYTIEINQHITNFEEVKNSVVTEINEALADLVHMEETVNGLISDLENLAGTYVTQEQLDTLKQELQTAIEDAVSSIDFEQFKTEVEEMIVQSDWNEGDETLNSFIKNRTHYGKFEKVELFNGVTGDLEFVTDTDTTNSNWNFTAKIGELDITEGSVVHITLDDKTYVLPAVKRQIIEALQYTATGGNYVSKFEMLNTLVIGENLTTTNVSKEMEEIPFIMYEKDGNWFISFHSKFRNYLTITLESVGADSALAFVLKCDKLVDIKKIDGKYLGGEQIAGGVLTTDGNNVSWVKPDYGRYFNSEIDVLFDGNLPYVQLLSGTYRFRTEVNDIRFEIGGIYVVNFDNYSVMFTCAEENRLYTNTSGIDIKYYDGKLQFELSSNRNFYLNDDPANNGANLTIQTFSLKESITHIEPELLASDHSNYCYPLVFDGKIKWEKSLFVSSENGSIFKIIVSNDGTLSTEAVTE